MTAGTIKKRPLATFLLLSLLAHVLAYSLLRKEGTFDFSAPVGVARVLSVELKERVGDAPRVEQRKSQPASHEKGQSKGRAHRAVAPRAAVRTEETAPPRREGSERQAQEERAAMPSEGQGRGEPHLTPEASQPEKPVPAMSATEVKPGGAQEAKKLELPPPLRRGDEFVAAAMEKLSYRITLRGMPVGEAVLLARNDNGSVHIAVKVTSSPLISAIYPVDDQIETELVMGNYLITTIRQHEGSFQRNSGYTLMLREKKAFSTAGITEGFVTHPLPRSDVTDVVFGFYYLRNQPLEVGKSLLLHIFEAGKYAPTTVEVLRQERIAVKGAGEVETLVIVPRLQTPGIFRRTGEMFIWLTADERKVPVRVETTIPIGKVIAELVSSEVQREGDLTEQDRAGSR